MRERETNTITKKKNSVGLCSLLLSRTIISIVI
jgi:hypothetical protein